MMQRVQCALSKWLLDSVVQNRCAKLEFDLHFRPTRVDCHNWIWSMLNNLKYFGTILNQNYAEHVCFF